MAINVSAELSVLQAVAQFLTYAVIAVFAENAEIFRALRLEKNYSKEEILETYFNKVYFGNGCYGIEAAAEGYFGKTVGELSIAEAASIVGIPQFPYKYDLALGDWFCLQNK